MPIGILIVGLAAAAVALLLKGRETGETSWFVAAIGLILSCAVLIWLRLLSV